MPSFVQSVSADEKGIATTDDRDRFAFKAWEEITLVELHVSPESPYGPDVYWIIHGGEGPMLWFPRSLEGSEAVIAKMVEHLPGLSLDRADFAAMSPDDRVFVLWGER